MPFLLHINFEAKQLVKKALEAFYGIGPHTAQQVMARHYLHPTARIGSLSSQKMLELSADLTSMKIENEARAEVKENIKRLRDMGTYRGRRHAMGLPVRGQSTRTQISSARKFNKINRTG